MTANRPISMIVVLVGLTLAGPSRAAGVPYRRIAGLSASSGMMPGAHHRGRHHITTNQGQQQVARELVMTRALLLHADHDYDGHRIRAVEEISAALRTLGHHGRHGGGVANGGQVNRVNHVRNGARAGVGAGRLAGNNGGRMKKPQAASDAILRHALQNLTSIQSQMGGHRAATDVQRAIGQLQIALRIR